METIKNLIPASSRGTFYSCVAAVAPALIAWGILDEVKAAAIGGVLTAVVTLLFAVVHSTSNIRSAIYLLLGALTVALTAWGYGTGAQWDAMLNIVAPALGVAFAAANTPTEDDYVGEHRGEV
ncbi:hypothetical protein CHU67_00475 [Corynebacterium sp. LK19]|uniref:phage holin n=1 Tax=Corynebacterium sp. LK19 TaxID=2022660 RepID=UPI000B51874D|nr:hypothetical protein [Corynebacterium sp. LK19]ASE56541.1 hypothetical protein CEQ06_05920 [Corynebacterium jeikeium]ASE56605.1 hypothetical protein CEQ06_06265 [Corynebacterium jeikeium]TXS60901.1 hypothetical protein CHU67_00475 [Corynebacterium sp. LK19]